MDVPWPIIRNTLGHFHPALVHFPVGLVLAGAILEGWCVLKRKAASDLARTLLVLGLLGAAGAVTSGLALFRPEDFRDRVLAAAHVHRLLGLAAAGLLVPAALAGGWPGRVELRGRRLWIYRLLYGAAGGLVGLAGHYGGWIVFGWGKIWTL